jgi:hypothetical protein
MSSTETDGRSQVKPNPEQLLRVISERTGIAFPRLVDCSSLYHDFGVAGDDGYELIEEIGRQFQIDLNGINSARYFGPETRNLFHDFMLFLRGGNPDDDIVRLDIVDLKGTIETGIWQEPLGA